MIVFVQVITNYNNITLTIHYTLSYTVYDCGSLNNPVNGTVQFNLTTFGAIAVFTCDIGYNLTDNDGQDYRECLFGGWSGEDPTCQSKYYIISSIIIVH